MYCQYFATPTNSLQEKKGMPFSKGPSKWGQAAAQTPGIVHRLDYKQGRPESVKIQHEAVDLFSGEKRKGRDTCSEGVPDVVEVGIPENRSSFKKKLKQVQRLEKMKKRRLKATA
jgi:hypothetical protein